MSILMGHQEFKPPLNKKKSFSRACDACAIRKIKCQQNRPCSHCIANNIQCTEVRVRKKSGPKKLHKKTLETISNLTSSHPSDSAGDSIGDTSYANEESLNSKGPPKLIPINHLVTFVEIFQKWFYAVYPIQSSKTLIERIHNELAEPGSNGLIACPLEEDNAPLYCLTNSICACISSQMAYLTKTAKLDKSNNTNLNFILNDCSKFTCYEYVQQVLYARNLYDFRNRPSADTLLTSFFLYNYYMNTEDGISSAVLYLREAISIAQLMKLHRPSTYFTKDPIEEHLLKKIYYMLYITERFMCIEDSVPVVLDSTISIPVLDNEEFPDLLKGFLKLLKVFAVPDRSFFDDWTKNNLIDDNVENDYSNFSLLNDVMNSDNSIKYKQAWIVRIQHNLSTNITVPNDMLSDSQKVNILVSQHWMRSLAWHLSYQKNLLLASGDYTLSPKFPIFLARDFIKSIEGLPLSAFEVHGSGASLKILEIANGLVEVLLPTSPTSSPESDDSMALVKRNVNDHQKRIKNKIFLTNEELIDGYKLLCTLFKLVNDLKIRSSSPPNILKLYTRIKKIINYFNYTGFKNYEAVAESSEYVYPENTTANENNDNENNENENDNENVNENAASVNETNNFIPPGADTMFPPNKFNLDWQDFFDIESSGAGVGAADGNTNPASLDNHPNIHPQPHNNLHPQMHSSGSTSQSEHSYYGTPMSQAGSFVPGVNNQLISPQSFNMLYSVFMYPGRDTPILDTIFQSGDLPNQNLPNMEYNEFNANGGKLNEIKDNP